jgi:glycosyltransferase involved in cell wall biosynthesis
MAASCRVCLIIEGSYPYITGGVSAWVHELISDSPAIEFAILSLSPSAGQPLRYQLPANVREHVDVVISRRGRSRGRPKNSRSLFAGLRRIHEQLQTGSAPALEELIAGLPEGYFLYQDAIKNETAWEMLTANNSRHNPVYPFADYFWSWKTAHDMIFTALGARLPRADVYHAVSTGYAGLAACVAKIKTGKPYILTEHGLYHKEREMEIKRASFVRGYQRDMWTKIYYGLSRLSYRYADLIIALFEYNRQHQLELGADKDRTRVIPNGIDVERFAAVRREPREGFHVGLVGRVVPIKDIKTFITAAKIISASLPEARFYCIGPTDEDEGYTEDCRLLVKSFKLEERFTFTGRQDVREYYGFLDVLMLTSVREAQPLVVLEAYCAGVPVVSTRVGNVPELLDFDERFLAPSKDAEKLAAGVSYIHDHPAEMKKLIAENREKVLKFYNRREVHRTYQNLYLSMAAP